MDVAVTLTAVGKSKCLIAKLILMYMREDGREMGAWCSCKQQVIHGLAPMQRLSCNNIVMEISNKYRK